MQFAPQLLMPICWNLSTEAQGILDEICDRENETGEGFC